MKKHFCCVCGKEGKFEGYVCPDCREPEEQEKTVKPHPVCKGCNRTKVGGRWHSLVAEAKPNSICPDCIAAKGGYFEAVLQFRAEDFPKEKLEALFEKIMAAERRRGIHVEITKIEDKSYYFTKVKVARKIAKRIVKEWGVKPKETRKLVGYFHQKGKGKYRFTIFFDLDSSRIGK